MWYQSIISTTKSNRSLWRNLYQPRCPALVVVVVVGIMIVGRRKRSRLELYEVYPDAATMERVLDYYRIRDYYHYLNYHHPNHPHQKNDKKEERDEDEDEEPPTNTTSTSTTSISISISIDDNYNNNNNNNNNKTTQPTPERKDRPRITMTDTEQTTTATKAATKATTATTTATFHPNPLHYFMVASHDLVMVPLGLSCFVTAPELKQHFPLTMYSNMSCS